jgi:biopolymer transport protein ExbB
MLSAMFGKMVRSSRAVMCGFALFLVAFSTVSTVMVVTSPAAVAQDEAKSDAEVAKDKSALEFFIDAMGWKYLISFGALSFWFVAILVMNFMQIRREAMMPSLLVQGFEAQLNEKQYQAAFEMAKADTSFLGKVLASGMSKLSGGYGEASAAMQETGDYENMVMEHRLSYIALVGSIAPMLGLLGTVDGMVAAFAEISKSETPPPPAKLAEGVMTALITTLVGLVMAIPAVMIYAFLKNRLQQLGSEMGTTIGNLMGRFSNLPQKK